WSPWHALTLVLAVQAGGLGRDLPGGSLGSGLAGDDRVGGRDERVPQTVRQVDPVEVRRDRGVGLFHPLVVAVHNGARGRLRGGQARNRTGGFRQLGLVFGLGKEVEEVDRVLLVGARLRHTE